MTSIQSLQEIVEIGVSEDGRKNSGARATGCITLVKYSLWPLLKGPLGD